MNERDWDRRSREKAQSMTTAVPRRFRRIVGSLAVALTVLYLVLWRTSGISPGEALSPLILHTAAKTSIDRLYPMSSKEPERVIMLSSVSDEWGAFGTVDRIEGQKSYNPTILSLPRNSRYPYLTIVRGDPLTSYFDKEGQVTVWKKEIYAMMSRIAHPDDARWNPRALRRLTNEVNTLLPLSTSSNHTFPSCGTEAPGKFYLNVQGPEDPRVFWSALGEPLLLYNSHSERFQDRHCRVMHIVDLRSIYPLLEEILEDLQDRPPPIRFPNSLAIEEEDQYYIEKNWLMFSDMLDPQAIYFHRNLAPRHLSQWSYQTHQLMPSIHESTEDLEANNCLHRLLPLTHQPKDIHVSLHQTTPPVWVVLCNRGDCSPSIHNTVIVTLGHWSHKTEPRYYER